MPLLAPLPASRIANSPPADQVHGFGNAKIPAFAKSSIKDLLADVPNAAQVETHA